MAEKKPNTKPKKKPAKKPVEKVAEKPIEKPAKKVEKPAEKPAETPEKKDDKKKSKLALIICAVVAAIAVIVGVVVALLYSNQTDPADPRASLSYSTSFFIHDNNKYTLWDSDGKRVTEEEYDNQSGFLSGYAMVKKDDQYGIIRENGTMSVEFGKYGNIVSKSGLYLAQDDNTKEYFLLTGSGNELAKGNDLKVYTPASLFGFAAVETDGKIKLFNYEKIYLLSNCSRSRCNRLH